MLDLLLSKIGNRICMYIAEGLACVAFILGGIAVALNKVDPPLMLTIGVLCFLLSGACILISRFIDLYYV